MTVYDAPCQMLDSAIHYRLSKYGTIYYQRMGKLHDFPGVFNGLRHLRMEIHMPIPLFLRFKKFLLRVQYHGQPKTCRRCNSQEHISRDCKHIVIFNCEGTGHEYKECLEKVRCCICRKDDHMAIDRSYSWSKRPTSFRDSSVRAKILQAEASLQALLNNVLKERKMGSQIKWTDEGETPCAFFFLI